MNKNNQLIALIEKTDLNLNLKKITFDELKNGKVNNSFIINDIENKSCLLYTSDAADE